jgi:glycosyltransferase involved in cell wall biosynthesis
MKIDFITSQPHAACSQFYSDALKVLPDVTLYDPNIADYDVILVMTYDHELVPKIREINPKAKIGLIDPRNFNVLDNTKFCDFLIVDSIEMEDYWSVSKKPMFRYVEYPNIRKVTKTHTSKDHIKIGYHGNLVHLQCMKNTVTPALENLSKKYSIELVVMYNGLPPTGNEDWVPKGVKVSHVSWGMTKYEEELASCDIGLVPNNLVLGTEMKLDKNLDHKFNYSQDDYLLRFKMPSNPGRFVVFGKLGIPVVADFYPSALQYLSEDRKTGLVACNPQGWELCLEKLIKSHVLRQELGSGLQSLVEEKFNFDVQNHHLLNFLRSL